MRFYQFLFLLFGILSPALGNEAERRYGNIVFKINSMSQKPVHAALLKLAQGKNQDALVEYQDPQTGLVEQVTIPHAIRWLELIRERYFHYFEIPCGEGLRCVGKFNCHLEVLIEEQKILVGMQVWRMPEQAGPPISHSRMVPLERFNTFRFEFSRKPEEQKYYLRLGENGWMNIFVITQDRETVYFVLKDDFAKLHARETNEIDLYGVDFRLLQIPASEKSRSSVDVDRLFVTRLIRLKLPQRSMFNRLDPGDTRDRIWQEIVLKRISGRPYEAREYGRVNPIDTLPAYECAEVLANSLPPSE